MTTTKLTLHRGEDYVAIMQPDETTDTALVLARHPSETDVGVLTVMAAAPDMLAALQAIIERSSGRLYDTDQVTGETFDALARAAIAKAEGK